MTRGFKATTGYNFVCCSCMLCVKGYVLKFIEMKFMYFHAIVNEAD